MNIFVTYPDPVKCAQILDDNRVNKMITESLQMMAVALHFHGVPIELIPKNASGNTYGAHAHLNHPCTIWVRLNRSNYSWLLRHTEALCSEYETRRGKSQLGTRSLAILNEASKFIPEGELTPFVNCSLYKGIELHEAYKLTMEHKWANKKPKYKQTWCGSETFPGWPI